MPRTRKAPQRSTTATAIGLLVVSNVAANRIIPASWYIPWNVGVGGVLLWAVRKQAKLTPAELGIDRERALSGAGYGAAASGVVIAGYLVVLTVPATRTLFEDERANLDTADLLYRSLVAVPFGTVLLEELAFRGVLPALFRKQMPGFRADLAAAGLFGLWHVLPASTLTNANVGVQQLVAGRGGAPLTVAGAVVSTAVAGLGFSWLRNRSGSLLAPALLHTTINTAAYVVSWALQR